ncbi:uncharacterized protein LOC111386302 [Olea europaea var. sylvestris]|uniref:Uncharacterized protein LOC111386302 n=1 Tax=Olea europaea subsp. europaea TaxID=158383 RepID=A0A8S0T0Q5_OLEEU|nr:uncharacterized protein LOC111386302 [Olea europaea var. sylvestris]XP_022866534.1 uncharacterized protein LOC111386302 [Olea europaea var. sylvestris]XP_022866535.1 uncharacterized protein LOC111386302 [Olea europaea var. sylvestris]CAA2997106.1 uncharacterized protein LOC111386302 [Olea europaea subsp. europaea]
MRLLVSEDTTTPIYWLNWRFLLCAIWVLTSMLLASFLIWKYERSDNSKTERGETQQESPRILRNDESWKPCLKEIHPLFLVIFRLIAFCLLLVSLSFDVAAHGGELFYYYTQWTFTLVTIYFGFGLLLSINGCLQHYKANSCSDYHVSEVVEQGLYEPLALGVNENGAKLQKRLECPEEHHCSRTAGLCGYLFQILYQISAGAVTLTDGLYWTIIFPFLTIRDYELSFLTVVAHSLNAIVLLGDTALNSLGFPWYRISFFILWTATYVIFEWIIHAFVSIWWPYPILDLSFEYAPLWYLLVALLHIPCYGIFVLLVKVKHLVLSKRFPQSYQFCP